jgi:hypothetical protein
MQRIRDYDYLVDYGASFGAIKGVMRRQCKREKSVAIGMSAWGRLGPSYALTNNQQSAINEVPPLVLFTHYSLLALCNEDEGQRPL